jgi:SAM-dependent methyltransferase
VEASQYDIHASVDSDHWWWRARREILEATIERYAPERPGGLELAEVGCCTGGNLQMLARFGRVVATEPSSIAVGHLEARFKDPRIRIVRHAIPEPLEGRFDVIGLFDVIEHIPDDRGTMRWVAEHLAPGGIACVTAPAFDFLWSEQDDVVSHLRRYTPASLRAVVPPELEVVHLSCFSSFLFLPILVARIGMRMLRRRDRPPRSHLGTPPA